MTTSPPLRRCSACSAEIPAEAPQGLCPKCLLMGVASAIDPSDHNLHSEALGKPHSRASQAGNSAETDDRWPPPSIEYLSRAFPQLEIIELIGRGGMGFVYKARQPKLDRFVAIKILQARLADSPSFHERFEREARVLAKLQHPLIVSVYDFGEVDVPLERGTSFNAQLGEEINVASMPQRSSSEPRPSESGSNHRESIQPAPLRSGLGQGAFDPDGPATPAAKPVYLMLEFVDGVNLREAMRAGRFTPEQALAIVPQVCEALQYAHSKGVLHRDIKPENILLDTEGRVKIADFGIAKVLGPEIESTSLAMSHSGASESELAVTRLTATGSVLGTPLYMAPEQLIRPDTIDHRADIFSLGVVFYEMLTGELPMGRFAPPSEKSLVDQRIDEIVMRALAKERELRQQSAGEMKTEVETVSANPRSRTDQAGEDRSHRINRTMPPSPAPREIHWTSRFFWLLACMAAVVFLVPALVLMSIVAAMLISRTSTSPTSAGGGYYPPKATP